MTDNIQKLYEVAGVVKQTVTCSSCIYFGVKCQNLPCPIDYPPFTAEKQLELIKWLAHKAHNGLLINKHITDGGASMVFDNLGYESTPAGSFISFEECLANLINNVWINLTEEERTQIKEILGNENF